MKPKFLPLWCAAVFATALAFIVHLSVRFETVRLGYDVSEARAQQRQLRQDLRMLQVEAATLRQSGRVEAVARGSLGMINPKPTRIITMGAAERRRQAAGRLR